MIPMKWFDVNEDDPYEMVWCKWRWSLWNGLMLMKMIFMKRSDVNEDDSYEMVWCKWRWSLWNGLM